MEYFQPDLAHVGIWWVSRTQPGVGRDTDFRDLLLLLGFCWFHETFDLVSLIKLNVDVKLRLLALWNASNFLDLF